MSQKKAKKLVLIWAIFMLVIVAKKEAFKNTGIGETSENSKIEDKDENLGINFVRVACIQYPITF